jgi:hypothetical protein
VCLRIGQREPCWTLLITSPDFEVKSKLLLVVSVLLFGCITAPSRSFPGLRCVSEAYGRVLGPAAGRGDRASGRGLVGRMGVRLGVVKALGGRVV